MSTHVVVVAVSQVKAALQDWEREQALYVEVGSPLCVLTAHLV